MPRKGSATDEDLLKDLPEAEESGDEDNGNGHSGGGAAEVAVRGKGRTVADALKKAGLKGAAKDLKGKFNDLLKNPLHKITAIRVFPKQVRGADGKPRDCSEQVELPPPLTLDEIIQHLHDEFGGKKWNITVLDEDGEVLDRRNVDVPGEVRISHKPEDDFQIPDLNDVLNPGGKDDEDEEPEQDPLDREIARSEKESRLLMLERQNAQLRAQVNEVKGIKRKDEAEIPVADQIKAALAEQDARHRAELAERDKRAEMTSMEQRITDATSRQIGEMRSLIEKLQAGNPQQTTALSDLGHKLEILQTSIDSKIKDALSSYRETTNMQINALEKALDGKVTAIQTAISAIQARPNEPDPLKSIVPLITSSIERSTSGYKEMMGPLIHHMTAREERESAPANPLEETLETLGKFNLLGDRKSGDFGSRVVDFAEKMAPEVLGFIREEKRQGREVTEGAIRNHLKLQAEKISREVQAAAAQEIRKIRATQPMGLPGPAQPVPSPVGRMPLDEAAIRQQVRPTAPAVPTPAPAPVAVQPPVPPPAPVQPPAPPQAAPVHQEVPEEEEEGDEDGEEMTVEEEMAARVNSTLEILKREMVVRPRQVTWPNAAWDDLPGAVLDQIIFANDEEDVYNAIKPLADPALAESIWEMVRKTPQYKEFIVAGINQIKGWAVELQQKSAQAAGAVPQEGAAGGSAE